MRVRFGIALTLVVALLGASACATEQWYETRYPKSHWASGDHAFFSLRNQGPAPKVTRQDVRLAGSQGWWGGPVVVKPEQIFEN